MSTRKLERVSLGEMGDGRHVDRSRYKFRMRLPGRTTHLKRVIQILISRPSMALVSLGEIAHPSSPAA